MQPLHTLQHVLLAEPRIGSEHVFAAPAFVPQAASTYVIYHHRHVTTPENHPPKSNTSSAPHARFVLHSYTIDLCVVPAHIQPCK